MCESTECPQREYRGMSCKTGEYSRSRFQNRAEVDGFLMQGETEDAVKACTEGSLWATVDMNAPFERALSFAG